MSVSQAPAVTEVQQKILDRLNRGDVLSSGASYGYRWRKPGGGLTKERAVNIDTVISMKRKGLVTIEQRAKTVFGHELQSRVVVPAKQEPAT